MQVETPHAGQHLPPSTATSLPLLRVGLSEHHNRITLHSSHRRITTSISDLRQLLDQLHDRLDEIENL